MIETKDPIREAIDGRYPIIYIQSAEEGRAVRWLQRMADRYYQGIPLHCWTCTQGFDGDMAADETRDPVTAIQTIIRDPRPGIYILKDLSPFLDRPTVARALRDAYYALTDEHWVVIVILSPELIIPRVLEKNIHSLQLPPPEVDEIEAMVKSLMSEYTSKMLPPDWLRELTYPLRGLTLDEARHVLHRVLSTKKFTRDRMLDEINASKKTISSGTSFLQYVPQLAELDSVGGLSNLKGWIASCTRVFSQKSLDAGLPVPKGILIMGISGCGKSLSAKVVAKTWRVPLFRLDMNMIFSDIYGNPEATFHRALQAIESVAPAVLWIDEIENGLGMTGDRQQTGSHILSAFLTWMQEKPPLVFVAATANRIEALPAEMIRKGRFDQVFFCDLPNEQERAEIFGIHIRRNQGDPSEFDMERLVSETEDWNAAEIEQAVIAARIDTAGEQRPFGTEDIVRHGQKMVPLSQTMSEQIKFIRDWAWDRATPASVGQGIALN